MSTENNEPENETEATAETEVTSTGGDHSMGMLCHLISLIGFVGVPFGNIVGPLILWLVKKDEDAFVDATGKEVLNFQISMTIYAIVAALLTLVIIGFIILPILIIANIIYTIVAAIKANDGELYKYPFTIQFIK